MQKQIKRTIVAFAVCLAPLSAQAGSSGFLSGETEQRDNSSLFVDEEQQELFEEAAADHGYSRESYSSTGYTYARQESDGRTLISFTTPKTRKGNFYYIQTDQLSGGRTKTTVGITNIFTYNRVIAESIGSDLIHGDASYFGEDNAKMDDFLLGFAAATREYGKTRWAQPIEGSYPISTAGTHWCSIGCAASGALMGAMLSSIASAACGPGAPLCHLFFGAISGPLIKHTDQVCEQSFDCNSNPRPSHSTSEPRPNHGGY